MQFRSMVKMGGGGDEITVWYTSWSGKVQGAYVNKLKLLQKNEIHS